MFYFYHVRFPYAYVVACFSSDIPIMIVPTIGQWLGMLHAGDGYDP